MFHAGRETDGQTGRYDVVISHFQRVTVYQSVISTANPVMKPVDFSYLSHDYVLDSPKRGRSSKVESDMSALNYHPHWSQ